MHLSILVLSSLSSLSLAQSCSLMPNPDHPANSNKFICGKQGSLGSPLLARGFDSPTSDATGCANECFSDGDCKSFSYNPKKNICQTYSGNLRSQGFARQKNTGDYFYFETCYIKTGDCGFVNGDFEQSISEASMSEGEPNAYMPWAHFTEQNRSTVALTSNVDNDDSSSDGDYFIEITTNGDDESVFYQYVTLLSKTEYTLTFEASVLSTSTNGSYIFIISYGETQLVQVDLDDFEIGVWYNQSAFATSTNFTSAHVPIKGTPGGAEYLAVYVISNDGNESGEHVTVGLDSFLLTVAQ